MLKRLLPAVILLAAALCWAVAATGQPPATRPSATVEAGELLLVRVPDLVQAGDTLELLRPVGEDGTITLPFGVVVQAAGKTADEVRKAIGTTLVDRGIFRRGQDVGAVVYRWRTRGESPFGDAKIEAMAFLEVLPPASPAQDAPLVARVDADGRVGLPLAPEALPAAGKSIAEVEREYAEALVKANVYSDVNAAWPMIRRLTREEAEQRLDAARRSR